MAILKTTGLTRQFGGLMALSDVSIEVREKEIIGVIGPNGAGKSTFVNVISGVYLPSAGKVEFYGRDITMSPTHEKCHAGISRTFQLMRPLVGLSLLENIMIGAMFGKMHRLKEARKISLGLCQLLGLEKVEMARALATEPKLLLLDEAMAGLNKEETMEMVETVRKIHAEGMTIVIIEHVMRVIRELTERVVVLEWGKVLAEGPYDKVSGDPRVITAYLGEEAEC